MADQGRGPRTAAGTLAAMLLALSGCAAPGTADDGRAEIQTVLDRRAAAVLAHDSAAYLAEADPATRGLRERELRDFDNLADLPLGSWAYRLTGVRRDGARASADAELSYRIKGYDTGPVSTTRRLTLVERSGRWYVSGDRPADGAAQQLWQQGDIEVVRGERSLVLGVGQPSARLRGIADVADAAVPAVSAAWPGSWAGRVVVLVPASLDAMGALLGAEPAGYRGIAAVTTGETGGAPDAPADRVIVNPEAYGMLGDFGQRIVLTHETAHVATRTATSPSTPMWLSEGFADWAAYRDTGRGAGQAAPELRRAVRDGRGPAELPTDHDFAFGGDADALARAYEGGWLACELIADEWGEEKLTAFYRAVGAHPSRDGAVEKALADVLGTTPPEFTERWRDYLRDRLG
ncbi:hypothetical protein ABT160_28215 [Streptomyces sp. NPDC001941]|uniref:hypothetical protein n=1 Tax=Streptomyces sp. NPDC001941 TaxID=3154659 RepID=UPI003332915D